MSFNSTLIAPTKEPHLESFPHNLHSLIPFMQSEALTFMVGRYISPPFLVSPLSCMVMGEPGQQDGSVHCCVALAELPNVQLPHLMTCSISMICKIFLK